ncbi:MAG: methyl-accepting chemotaxis protein [Helicobacteraceae bacterium]|nr:methyl-accepting chemotaxis protein [Helicobacteraceae bacterium]
MSRRVSAVYWIAIAAALFASFAYLRAQVIQSGAVAERRAGLERAHSHLKSLFSAAIDNGWELKTEAERTFVWSAISAIEQEDKGAGTRLKGKFTAFMDKGGDEDALFDFNGEITALLAQATGELKTVKDLCRKNDVKILFAGALTFITALTICAAHWYLGIYRRRRYFLEIAAHIERLEGFVTGESNEFERLAELSGSEGAISKQINRIASLREKQRDEDIKTLGEVLLLCAQVDRGHINRRLVGEPETPLNGELVKAFNRMMQTIGALIQSVLETLELYRRGEFTRPVERGARDGESARLINCVNGLGAALGQIASMNLKHSVALSGASEELIGAVASLTEVSARESSSVDRITASVRDIIQDIEETTHKAEQMAAIAIEARESAANGLVFSHDTVKAMEEINASTALIKEATAVIDSISFQTNILSLNAAVEAATAGEAGKGFAVVASEVRSLAGKSAEAAKRIKELVAQTQLKANEGMGISKRMIEGFEDLSNKVSSTHDLVNAVTAAMHSGMNKVGNINQSIEELVAVNHQSGETAAHTGGIARRVSTLADQLMKAARGGQATGADV